MNEDDIDKLFRLIQEMRHGFMTTQQAFDFALLIKKELLKQLWHIK